MPSAPPRKPARRFPLWALTAGGAVIAALVVAAFFIPWGGSPSAESPTAFVRERINQSPCTWAYISRVLEPDGNGERFELGGISAAPESLQTGLLQQAEEQGVPLAAIDVRNVVPAPQAVCGELETIRPYRSTDSDRLRLIPHPGPLVRTEYGWRGELEFELDFANLPQHAALLGLDTQQGIDVLIPDLHAFRRQAPPERTEGSRAAYKSYFFDENQNARNVGLILMTAARPIDPELVQSIGRQTDRESLRRIREAAEAGQWRFELGVVRCGIEMGPNTRC